MNDITNRKLENGDFAVVAIGRNGGCDMFRGVIYNDYLWYRLSWSKDLCKTQCKNMYKIENPTQSEINLKDSIYQQIIAEENKKNALIKKKKETKAIRAKDLKPGSFYIAINGLLL